MGVSRRARGLALLLAGAFLQSSCRGWSEEHISLSGTVSVAPRLQKRAEQPNLMLFIIASNAAGVPIAVRRIINPQFPVSYQIKTEDVVLPGPVWRGKLTIRANANTHGQAGILSRGDLVGVHPRQVYSGERGVDILIDREN